MGVVSGVKSFLLENFWLPVTGDAAGYNVFNTSFYAAGFALAAAYIGYPVLKRLDVSLDRSFFMGIAPFVFLGGAVRVLEDLQMVDSFLLVTPFIYVTMFLYTVAALLVSLKAAGLVDREYHEIMAGFGLIPLMGLLLLYYVNGVSIMPLVQVALVLPAVLGVGYLLLVQFRPSLATYSFGIPVAAHYWDATTSAVAISLGASEKHVLAGYFVNSMGPAGMFVMKTAVIVPIVYYLVNSDIDPDEKKYYLFLIALLGFALGTRNLLSVAAG